MNILHFIGKDRKKNDINRIIINDNIIYDGQKNSSEFMNFINKLFECSTQQETINIIIDNENNHSSFVSKYKIAIRQSN